VTAVALARFRLDALTLTLALDDDDDEGTEARLAPCDTLATVLDDSVAVDEGEARALLPLCDITATISPDIAANIFCR
jgi:hypothetical protein